MGKYNNDDVQEIARQIRTVKNDRPFVMLTGAGCSVTAGIPTAQQIIADIHEFADIKPHLANLSADDSKDYGRVMDCLDLTEREKILKEHLDKAKVNWGHIAMATMLDKKYICRVLTFNFDNILARACGKCGLYPNIYDFVSGVARSGRHIVDPAIVHLHGQGFGIAMLNSENETSEHAQNLKPLLNETVEKHPLLVIGYSGLSDRVFPIIQEVYMGRNRVHWVDLNDEPNDNIAALRDRYPNQVKYYGGAEADIFLVDLARALSCFPPNLFKLPTEHLRQEIADILPFSQSKNRELDVKSSLEAQLDSYDQLYAKRSNAVAKRTKNIDARGWYLAGEYDKIIEAYETNPESIPDHIAADAYIGKGNNFYERGEVTENIDDFKDACVFFEKSTLANPKDSITWFNWSAALDWQGDLSKNTAFHDLAIDKLKIAVRSSPPDADISNLWGAILIGKYLIIKEPSLLDDAQIKIDEALQKNSSDAYYAACLASLKGNYKEAKKHLETCRKTKNLRSIDDLKTSKSLALLREDPWFDDFIKRVEAKT